VKALIFPSRSDDLGVKSLEAGVQGTSFFTNGYG